MAGIQGFLPTIIPSFGFGKHGPRRHFLLDLLMRLRSGHGGSDIDGSTVRGCRCDSLLDDVHFGSAAAPRRIPRRRGYYPGRLRIYVREFHPFLAFDLSRADGKAALVPPGSLLLAFPSHDYVRYFAASCTCAGTVATIALVLTWCACCFLPLLHMMLALISFLVQSLINWAWRRRRRRACCCTCASDSAGASWVRTCSRRRTLRVTCEFSPMFAWDLMRMASSTGCGRGRKGFAVTCGLQFLSVVVAGVLIVSLVILAHACGWSLSNVGIDILRGEE